MKDEKKATQDDGVAFRLPPPAFRFAARDAPQKLARLTNFLLAKSIVEAMLIGALAIGFYLTAFAPYLRGALDKADAQHVAGWAVDEAQPSARLEVQLYIDGRFAASGAANLARPDVRLAGRAEDDFHGFNLDTPPLSQGEHEARVYAVHESGGGKRRTLQLIGKPLRFSVNEVDAHQKQ